MHNKTELPIISNPPASRSRLTRRAMLQRVLAGLGAALASPVAARAHPMYRHLADATSLEGAGAKVAGSDWAPEFLAPHQNDTLSALAEGVVPGSTRAQVNRVIDLLLTVETAENRQKFAAALTAVDSESKKRFSRPIADLPAAQLAELLSAVSTAKQSHPPQTADSASIAETNQNTPAEGPATLRDHFENLKGWIVATYYSSEPGMRELGWADEFYFEGPPECTHPEGHP